ncbi:erythromycin esterase-like protein [Anseongella ginsenosidimutans]|uniref:Erythromycin esterase-like protein n=1 Tax=Anseongella ginsenosidimutans TaxID=496056 RepID=A0A4R3KUE1_9SPHI|nr:erythromycin esterase family protein [Anseongella ginsenosidimutans]QEC51670.1 erythromycin esterase family protein [Anseongella ginsenosidimutans]TCS89019.1 erythromycin esterase-like protein [Anseongella ginsenosidimutans]
MKRVLSILLFYFLLAFNVYGQDIKNYVIENTVEIESVSPIPDQYEDLEVIGGAIGDAQIVMLGEQDHGDAPTFLAKTRLIKYLHEKKGFNILAFESDFYGLTKGWDQLLKQPDSVRQFIKKNIYPLWTRSDACQYLFEEYIPETFRTEKPIQLSGFDPQLVLDYSYKYLKNDLDQYLNQTGLATELFSAAEYKNFLIALEALIAKARGKGDFNGNLHETLDNGLELIKNEQHKIGDSSYWPIVIRNLIAFNNNSNEVRDKAMSENLKFLISKKYKGEKVIVWAANTHIMKYTDKFKIKKRLSGVIWKNMGTDFTGDLSLEDKTYILGFTSRSGTAGRLWTEPFSVEPANENALENWIGQNIDYGFIDFKSYNLNSDNLEAPFLMKGPMHFYIPDRFLEIPWNLVYDGVFFIREMYPVKLEK